MIRRLEDRKTNGSPHQTGFTPVEVCAIQDEIRRIAASAPFERSPRMKRFLEYTVDETIRGNAHRLKEYSVARGVFDKPEDFDPRMDPIVRVEARRLRDKLREYYTTNGRADPIVIWFDWGYAPTIVRRNATFR